MAKTPNTIYVCQECGRQERKWHGMCSDCGKWDTFVEETFRPTAQKVSKTGAIVSNFRNTQPISYNEIESQDDARISSGIEEFDRVLGGGIVAGSLVLIGGSSGNRKIYDHHSNRR